MSERGKFIRDDGPKRPRLSEGPGAILDPAELAANAHKLFPRTHASGRVNAARARGRKYLNDFLAMKASLGAGKEQATPEFAERMMRVMGAAMADLQVLLDEWPEQ